jgi:hypothetical protein
MVLLALQYAIFFVVVVCGSVSHVPSVNFMLLGDWGLPGYNQSLIAAQMATWADANHSWLPSGITSIVSLYVPFKLK